MLQSNTIHLLSLLLVAVSVPHAVSADQRRVYTKNDSEPNVNRDGEFIIITPTRTSNFDILCSDPSYNKHWYRVSDQSESSIIRLSGETTSPDVYAINTGGYALTLQFRPFRSTHIGEYECRFTRNGVTAVPLSVFLGPTPPPTPSKVRNVTVQGSSPALRVSWSAVSGSGITYTVCYSTTRGTRFDHPSNANCDTSGITGTSTTLGPLSRGTTYYIWVAAVSPGGQGPYSNRISAVVEQRLYTSDTLEGEVDLENGATLTITPAKTYDILCSDTRYVKDWYRVLALSASSISRYGEYMGRKPDVYATNTGGHALTLHFQSFQSTDSGEYECRLRPSGLPTLSVFLTPTPQPTPAKVQDVTVTKAVQGSSPTLRVSWSAVGGSGITYTVCYSKTSGTQSDPPSNANCETSGIAGTSTTLGPLSRGTTYHIWVAAVSSGGTGPSSNMRQNDTYDAPNQVTSLQLRPSTIIFGLIITWGPPSGSNYPTPVTYQLRYRERPSSGSPGGWSRTVQRTATQRQYTTPVLKPGTRYEVEVWAVTSIGRGQSVTRYETTLELPGTVSNLQVKSWPLSYLFNVTWQPPSGSNYPTPVAYRLRYRERLSSRSPGVWSSTVQRTTTKRQYTTPVLKPGTRYEVEVWAVSGMKSGPRLWKNVTTVSWALQEFSVIRHSTEIALIVKWQPPRRITHPTGYKLRYHKTPSDDNWSAIMNFDSNKRQYTINGLESNTNYEVQVWAVVGSSTGGPEGISSGSAITGGILHVSLEVSTITTSSITVIPSGPPGNVSYKELGSSAEPTHVPYLEEIMIPNLQPNTVYSITYSASNNYGTSNTTLQKPTLSEAPSNLDIMPLSSNSLQITWNPPGNHQSLQYYVNYTAAMLKTRGPIANTSVEITGLHPYKEYTISVQAGNRAGLSVPVTGTARTYSDKPSSKPSVTGLRPPKVASTWCVLAWKIPREGGRNGIIINYVLELEHSNSTKWSIVHELSNYNYSFPNIITHNVTNLTPYTTYMWRVAAATVNGTGSLSPIYEACQTSEDKPGPVFELSHKKVSDMSVTIFWSPPMSPNGVIRSYMVLYKELEGNETFKLRTYHNQATLISLQVHTPYEVNVSARTLVGLGVPSSLQFFTVEGVPVKPVEDVVASRTASGRVNISWTPLSLVDARGFPLYTISYMSDGDQVESVNATESSVIIPGLSLHRTYIFTIQVSTENGTGEAIARVTLRGDALPTKGGGPAGAVAAAVAVLLIIIIAAIVAICIVVYCRRHRKAAAGTSAMMPVHCEKKGENEYSLGINTGGKADVASILGELPVMADGGQKIITRKSFLAVTKQLHLNRDRGFEEEFKTIVNDPNGSDVIAKANRRKNRYGNITTYDHCRVVLSVPDENGSDYINASYINGYAIENAYIASQGPTPNTVSDFWQMLWDQECPVIVMLTKVEEKGKKKCHQYWEDELLKPYEPGRELEVTVTSVKGYANYDVREITLSNPSSGHSRPHKLKQFHYTGWPDHGVPTHPSSLVKFAQQVRREYRDSTAPLLVHCSAGVGRTGTFITIDAMLERLQEKDNLNIYQFVTAMRTRRTFMVQTMEQYAFIHDALCDYLMCGDTSVAAHELRMEIQSLHQADAKTRKSGFQQKFELLDTVSKKPVSEDESFSRKTAVVKKNRYKDKFPYSNCFVRAPGKGPTGGADYINASYIDSYSRNKAFIAAQAPLESTKSDVWEMIWQYRPSTVVVLCDFQKERQEACSRFWPDEREKTLNVGFLKVNNECTERDTTYDVTRLEVFDSRKESSKVLNVSLFHLKDWDKDGRPTTEAVLRLMGDVQNTTASPSGDVIPAVVMCDDGMGRSGVFICAMSEVERVKVEGQVDVFQTIKGMRIQRPHMVETPDQYKLCFEILQSYLDSFDTYANFKAV